MKYAAAGAVAVGAVAAGGVRVVVVDGGAAAVGVVVPNLSHMYTANAMTVVVLNGNGGDDDGPPL